MVREEAGTIGQFPATPKLEVLIDTDAGFTIFPFRSTAYKIKFFARRPRNKLENTGV